VIQVSADLRNLVRTRASDRCEYCRIPQAATPFLRLQLEHIIARQHGGLSAESNLAWSCRHCNLHKGPNLTGIDPQQRWCQCFFIRDGKYGASILDVLARASSVDPWKGGPRLRC